MRIRRFEAADAPYLTAIFYRSVHEVASALYTPEQCAAWAPAIPDHESWLPRMLEYDTFVALDDDDIRVAWIAITSEGYVDMLFCLPEAAGRGFASALYAEAERAALSRGVSRLTAHASLLAQPFFLKHGWTIDRHEVIERRGVSLPRAEMSKALVGLDARSLR